MKLAIIGSRQFDDYVFFKEQIGIFLQTHGKPTLIISGGAKGAIVWQSIMPQSMILS